MALSDCRKCWDTPCTCGHNYRNMTSECREELAAVILGFSPAAERAAREAAETQRNDAERFYMKALDRITELESALAAMRAQRDAAVKALEIRRAAHQAMRAQCEEMAKDMEKEASLRDSWGELTAAEALTEWAGKLRALASGSAGGEAT